MSQHRWLPVIDIPHYLVWFVIFFFSTPHGRTGLTEQTGDPGLDTVLGEIDLRVAVELAKAGIR